MKENSAAHVQLKSTFRVSGFSLDPISIIDAPIMIFSASTIGTRFEKDDDDGLDVTLDNRFMAISGDHEPIISPHCMQTQKQYFLFQLGIFLTEMQV